MARANPAEYLYWLDSAVKYCSRHETSRPLLEQFLYRKLERLEPDDSLRDMVMPWIAQALDRCQELKYIDHGRLTEVLTHEYTTRGKGSLYVAKQLEARGIPEEIKNLTINPEDEMNRAVELATKQLKRSTIQKLTDPEAREFKLLQKLLSSGFEQDAAERAVRIALKLTDTR